MRTRKMLLGLVAFITASGVVSSCSQDDVMEQSVETSNEKERTVTVKELTEQLRAYNAKIYGVTRASQEPWMADLTEATNIRMKVAAADIKGAIRGGKRGGWGGALLGGAACSLFKLAWDHFFPSNYITEVHYPAVIPAGDCMSVGDSVGYYHNMLEYTMYNENPESHLVPSLELMKDASGIMMKMSSGFAAYNGLDGLKMASIAADIDNVRTIDTSDMTFDEYCDKLIEQNPEDKDYIDFAAEYLYIVNYANVDIENYTTEVMFMINNSNVGIEDVTVLGSCIQVAYASSVFAGSR